MSERIKENIRFYLPNDPYHHDVDNLPLRDLVDNDKKLQTQVDSLVDASKAGSITDTSRRNLSELRPYVAPGQPGKIFVNPGVFVARVDSPSKNKTGIYEKPEGGSSKTDSGDTQTEVSESRSAAGAGRTSVIRLLTDEEGSNPWVQIPEWSTDDFSEEAPAARVDLVYIKAYPGFEDEALVAEKPTLGVLKGAGQISNEQLTRHLGKPINEIFADSGDVDVDTNWVSVPLPEDIMNKAGAAERNESAGISWDMASFTNLDSGNGFTLPLCYVIVTNNFTAGTAISESNLIDIRPFLRTAELTLDERQAILNSSHYPKVNNPFVTENRLDQQIASIPEPDVPGDYGILGKIRFHTSYNDDKSLDTKPILVPPGKYIAFISGKAAWDTEGSLHWAIVNTDTGETVDSIAKADEGATTEITGNGDDDCHFMDFVDIVLDAETLIEARGSDFEIIVNKKETKRRWLFNKKVSYTKLKKKGSINCQRMILIKYEN